MHRRCQKSRWCVLAGLALLWGLASPAVAQPPPTVTAVANAADVSALAEADAELVPDAAAPLPAGATRLTVGVEACYRRALRHSPLMKASRLGVDELRARLREANAARLTALKMGSFVSVLPARVDGSTGANIFTDYDWTAVGPLIISQLSFSQPIYTFGKLDTLRRLAKKGIAVARATDAVARAELRYQIERGYWTLVLGSELRDIFATGTKKLAEERERLELARDDGDENYNPEDLLELRILNADIEVKRRDAERASAFAADALRAAMGLEDALSLQPRHAHLVPVQVELLEDDDYVTVALANHPQLVAQRRGTAARLEQLRLREQQLWPDIAITGRVAYTYAPTRDAQVDSFATNPANPAQSGAGVTLQWNIDIFRRLARIDRARAQHNKQLQLERGERDKVRVDTRNLRRALVDAEAVMGLRGQAMRAARGFLTSRNEMYDNGFLSFDKVVDALKRYYQRKVEHLQSIHAYNLAVAALSRQVGVDIRRLTRRQPTGAARSDRPAAP